MRFVLPVTLTLAMMLTGCGDEAVPPPRAGAAPSGPARPNEAMLARLRADDPAGLRASAQSIVAGGDMVTRRAASARLAALARTAASQAALAHLLAAMEIVGGPEVVAYCLALGEYDAAPLELRKGALAVVVRWADRNDPAVRARSAAIWERVNAAPATPASAPAAGEAARGPVGTVTIGGTTLRGGTVANATPVIAGMVSDLRRCYHQALQESAGMHGAIEVTVRVDAAGAVSVMDESHTGITPALASCIVTRVQAASFAPPQGGVATVVIPITFEAR
jgi:hypothetical protein